MPSLKEEWEQSDSIPLKQEWEESEPIEEISVDPRRFKLATQEKIMSFVRPTLEMGGLVAGGILGGGAGLSAGPGAIVTTPTGAIIGSGLGYAGGRQIANILEQKMGMRGRPPLSEALVETGKDVLAGSTMEAGGQVAGKTLEYGLNKLFSPFSKKFTQKEIDMMKLAEKKKVPLTPAEIIESRPISLAESALSFIPGSSGVIQNQRINQLNSLIKLREELLDKVSEGAKVYKTPEQVGLDIRYQIDKFVSGIKTGNEQESLMLKNKLLKSLGSDETYESIGMATQEAIAKKSQIVNEKAKELYDTVGNLISGETKIKTSNVQKTANNLLEKELAKPSSLQDKSIIKVLYDLSGKKNLPEGFESFSSEIQKQIASKLETTESIYSWQTIQSIRSELNNRIIQNDLAYKTQQAGAQKMLGTTTGGYYKQLRKAVEEDLETYFKETSNREAKDAWEFANAFYKESKRTFNKPSVLRLIRANPDRVVDMAFRPNGVTEIRNIKKILAPQEFNELSKKFTNKLISRASQRDFSWEKVMLEFNKYGEETLSNIYTIPQLKSIRNMIETGIKKDNPVIDDYLLRVLKFSDSKTIFNTVFRPNSYENVVKIKGLINKDTIKDAKRLLTENILELNEFGVYRPFKATKNISKFDERTLNAIYNKEELEFLKEIISLSKKSFGSERLAGNPSGTAQSIITFQAGRAILKNPVTGLSYFLLPQAMAKIYLSPLARKYFTEGFKLPGNLPRSMENLTKLLSILGRDAIPQESNE